MPTEEKKKINNNNNTNPPTKRSKTQQVRSESLEGGQDSAGNLDDSREKGRENKLFPTSESSQAARGNERLVASAALQLEETAPILDFFFFFAPSLAQAALNKVPGLQEMVGKGMGKGGRRSGDPPRAQRGGEEQGGRRASARTGKQSRVKQVRLRVQTPAGDGDVREVKPQKIQAQLWGKPRTFGR